MIEPLKNYSTKVMFLISNFFSVLHISCEQLLSVKFYEDSGSNLWTLPDASYEILDDDILGQLSQPSMGDEGIKTYFKFSEYPF